MTATMEVVISEKSKLEFLRSDLSGIAVSRISTMRMGLSVARVERQRNPGAALPRRYGRPGFRSAQSGLQSPAIFRSYCACALAAAMSASLRSDMTAILLERA